MPEHRSTVPEEKCGEFVEGDQFTFEEIDAVLGAIEGRKLAKGTSKAILRRAERKLRKLILEHCPIDDIRHLLQGVA